MVELSANNRPFMDSASEEPTSFLFLLTPINTYVEVYLVSAEAPANAPATVSAGVITRPVQ